MNKDEMEAYKNYDQKQYMLVPGLQHSKHIRSPVVNSTKLLGNDTNLIMGGSPRGSQRFLNNELKQSYDSNDKLRLKTTLLSSLGYNEAGRFASIAAGAPSKSFHENNDIITNRPAHVNS